MADEVLENETTNATTNTHCLIRRQNLVNIANAIRGKTGDSGTLSAGDMATAISNISTGINPTGTISITQNGTDIDVTQYAAANVAVPQPSGKITISQNGTDLDIAQYATADVSVGSDPAKGFVLDQWDADGYATRARFIGEWTAIQGSLIGGDNHVEEVVIPDTVTQFEVPLVNGAKTLKKITIGSGINRISGTFIARTATLTELILRGNMTGIFNYAFNVPNLKKLIFEGDMKNCTIGAGFWNGTSPSLELLDISNSSGVVKLQNVSVFKHADGCVIKVKQEYLTSQQEDTNWCDLPTDSSETGYVVWQGV